MEKYAVHYYNKIAYYMLILDQKIDNRCDCISIICSMTLERYRQLAYNSFMNSGNLEGQRTVIRRSSAAAKIRNRMQDDFRQGAIFPQVVLGALITPEELEHLKNNPSEAKDTLQRITDNNISIIDGMQRSSIYFSNYESNSSIAIRVEIWFASDSLKMLYRMLVLNTGQVPWNTRRQLEVIYTKLSQQIETELLTLEPTLSDRCSLYGIDDGSRRTQGGEYQKSVILECYLGFNTRHIRIDVVDELAEEFQRFDMIESVDNNEIFKYFIQSLCLMCKLDIAFSGVPPCPEQEFTGQYRTGKDIFTSIPACLGFMVACAEYIFGRQPIKRNQEEKNSKIVHLTSHINSLINTISGTNSHQFLALDVLNDMLESLPKTRIGDDKRRLFRDAFLSIFKCEDLTNLTNLSSFWRE